MRQGSKVLRQQSEPVYILAPTLSSMDGANLVPTCISYDFLQQLFCQTRLIYTIIALNRIHEMCTTIVKMPNGEVCQDRDQIQSITVSS